MAVIAPVTVLLLFIDQLCDSLQDFLTDVRGQGGEISLIAADCDQVFGGVCFHAIPSFCA